MKKLILLMLIPAITFILSAQSGLTGSWKYSAQGGEMNMQITAETIMINNQVFPYKAQGNVLMINEGTTISPYPYMLDGNQLTIEFPGGTEVVFTRTMAGPPAEGPLPQSMSRPMSGTGQGQNAAGLSGKWLFQNQQGQLLLEFISANRLSFNGESTQYQLKEGIIQAMGDYGWIDYPYTLNQGILTITFPDGSKIPFKSAGNTSGQQYSNQQGISQQAAGSGATWQLRGTLCSWSGSSNSSSGYSRTRKLVFDGQGNYQFGTEASFSSGAGIAYGGNPNVETGTYFVGESTVTLRNSSGESYQFKINMRQDNGMITELMLGETLYATGLCE